MITKMLENIRISFRSIVLHKMRSFLTMLGIIIGIASIIAIVSTIKGTNEQIKNNLVGAGNNTLTVALCEGDWQYEFQYMGVPIDIPIIDNDTKEQLKELPEVNSLTLMHIRNYADGIFRGNAMVSGIQMIGIESNYLDVAGLSMRSGRGFVDSDYANFKKVAIVDEKASKMIFGSDSPLGKTIDIYGEPFTIVGVAGDIIKFEPVINTIDDYYMFSGRSTGRLFVPISAWPIINSFDEQQSVLLRVKSVDSMTVAGKKAEDILNSRIHNAEEVNSLKYKSDNLLEQAKRLQELSSSTNKMLIWIAGISLIVGGIGVMNIMLVSVTERTREIGLKKAVGAPKKTIMKQFLTEASVLTSIGGILGVLVGIALAFAISKIATAPISISLPAIIISVAFSVVVGLIFGLLPSIKAANLNPIDALRYE